VRPMLWVGAGGFLGANARYLLGGWIADRWVTAFPIGTFLINITGSFALGLFLAFAEERPWMSPDYRLAFAIGFVGAYTTFSTFSYETIRLLQDGAYAFAAANVIGSVLLGLISAFAGFALGSAL
jgi:CrcB protein